MAGRPRAPADALIGLERPINLETFPRSRLAVGWLVNHVKATSAAGSSFLSKRGILNRLAFKVRYLPAHNVVGS